MWELLRKRNVKSLGSSGGYGMGILSLRNHHQQVCTSVGQNKKQTQLAM